MSTSVGGTRLRIAAERRRLVVFLAVALAIILIVGRLVWVQLVQGPTLAAEAQEARTVTREILAPRGQIFDANGEILAASVERYDIGARPSAVAEFVHHDEDGEEIGTGPIEAARLIAPILGESEAEVGGRLVGEGFTYLARSVTPDVRNEIVALGIPGIETDRSTARYYPNGTTAGNIIGFTDSDGIGQAGLEQTFNTLLTGVNGTVSYERGSGGQIIPGGQRAENPAEPGADLRLTIERDLQFQAQTSIDEMVERRGAQWGAVVVEEIGTGRLLALADSDSVDPNDVALSDPADRGARSVGSPFEPGSTGKLVTFAAALDEGTVSQNTVFTVPDIITMPNGQVFRDNETHDTWRMHTSGIVANSLNTGTVQIGDTLDDEDRYGYLRSFGFGQRTGIELPGESPGQLSTPDSWDGRQRYTTMFGQGYSTTLVQLNSMTATLGNHGVRVGPHLVDSIEHADGTIEEVPADAGSQVVSGDAARSLVEMMEGVTLPGATGVLADVPGYRIAGKTGTAQIADEDGNLTGRLGTFTGLIPAEDPRLAISVVVYQPQGIPYGGVVGAPVFADVAEFAMAAMNIPPSTEPSSNLPWSPDMPNPGTPGREDEAPDTVEAVPPEEMDQ